MGAEDLNLSGVKNVEQAIGRMKNGLAAVEAAKRMGIWTEAAHANPGMRATFPRSLSELSPTQLSDLYAAWTADFGRIIEMCGAISAQEGLLKIQLKSAQASARARIRRGQPEGARPLTQGALDDMIDSDAAVVDIVEQQAVLAVLAGHALAAKEATAQYLTTLSREISFRDAQMKARIY